MKKLILLFIIIAITSCKPENPVDYAIVSGKIANIKSDTIIIYQKGMQKKIPLKEGGVFSDTIPVNEHRAFRLYHDKELKDHVKLYLDKGENVQINFDANDADATLSVTGSNTISTYLYEKEKVKSQFNYNSKEAYNKDENEYKEEVTNLKNALNGLVAKSKGLPEKFKQEELDEIHYDYIDYLSMYESKRQRYTNDRKFRVSEDFFTHIKNQVYELSPENIERYRTSKLFKELLEFQFQLKAEELIQKNDTLDFYVAYLQSLSTIKNDSIRSDLMYGNKQREITKTKNLDEFYSLYTKYSTDTENNKKITEAYNKLKKVEAGSPSPKFNYENYAGGKTSLDDLKGKYVYIDVWATWCMPCIAELPYLKEIEKQFHGKNIAFVSISVDKKKYYDKWRSMVSEKQMGGIQLIADKDFESDFIKSYLITAIPRFILIDPKGNIISENAIRPSNKKLPELFKSLGI